jgi:hypothetical protein
MSDTQAKATPRPFDGLPNALARELVDMARHTSYADGVVQQVQAKLDTHYGKLLEALKTLLEAVAGEQRDPEELRKSLGIHAPAAVSLAESAIQSAEEEPNARSQSE